MGAGREESDDRCIAVGNRNAGFHATSAGTGRCRGHRITCAANFTEFVVGQKPCAGIANKQAAIHCN